MTHARSIERLRAHRPVPMPAGRWVMFQRWEALLFAHWPVQPDALRAHVPPPLEIDTYEGRAFIGLTPFCITAARPHYAPPVPGLSSFPEMNLRTYVRGDRPGVFFFTLDTTSIATILGARAIYRLPYRRAAMRVRPAAGWIHYASQRHGDGAKFAARYRPAGAAFIPAPGSLEHFLVERYALFQGLSNGSLLRGDIHHPPWSLYPAEVEIEHNTMLAAHHLPVDDPQPALTHIAAPQDTLIYFPKRLRGTVRGE